MANRRRYTNAQKVATVLLAEQTSLTAAAEASGIPLTTLDYWMDRPPFVALRARAREAMAEEALIVARRGWALLAERMASFDPRDLVNVVELATEKALLMAGDATTRSEHRDITDADDAGVASLEGVLAGSPTPKRPRVEFRRNGAGADGQH